MYRMRERARNRGRHPTVGRSPRSRDFPGGVRVGRLVRPPVNTAWRNDIVPPGARHDRGDRHPFDRLRTPPTRDTVGRPYRPAFLARRPCDRVDEWRRTDRDRPRPPRDPNRCRPPVRSVRRRGRPAPGQARPVSRYPTGRLRYDTMSRVPTGDGRLVACPDCDGPRRSPIGGVAFGGCPSCRGTGLLLVDDRR